MTDSLLGLGLLVASILVAIGFGFACEWLWARTPVRAAVSRRPSSPPAFVREIVDGFVDLARMAITIVLWLVILGGAVLLATTFGVTAIATWVTGLLGSSLLGLLIGAKLDDEGDAMIPTMIGAILLFVCLRLWFG